MNYRELGKDKIKVSEIGLGCMRMANLNKMEADRVIKIAIEQGINFFDHADIYGKGKSEEIFGEFLKENKSIRGDIVVQTKCAIKPGICYDFSKEHIIKSVDESLKRLNTDYVDTLLLHRPDTLMEPEEVAEAFAKLYEEGKVKEFGVSNHTPMQIELLNKYLKNKIIINQMQFSIMHTGMVDSGLNANMKVESSIDRDGGVLEYCRLKDILIQAWSPYQYGMFEGVFLDNDKFPEVNSKIDEIAAKYDVTNTAIATAWILRHPAKMQTIIGSMNESRIKDICSASNIKLSREEWYEIYLAAGNKLP